MRKWTLVAVAALAAAGFGLAVPGTPEAHAAGRAARGTLTSATYVSGTGILFRISGENMGRATWTRSQTTDRAGNVTGESGTAAVGRRTYSYSASFNAASRRSSTSGRVMVGGGILSPRRQTVRF